MKCLRHRPSGCHISSANIGIMVTDLTVLLKIGFTVIGLIAVLLVLSGCGQLSSEPIIISTASLPTVTPTAPPDVGRPAARVSLSRGAAIFNGAQGCQNCHGLQGKGDG